VIGAALTAMPSHGLGQSGLGQTGTPQPPADGIGTWISHCTGTPPRCTLHYREHLFSKAAITADLQIRAAGAAKVPVIILTGLPTDPMLAIAIASQVQATLALDQGPSIRLVCGAAADAFACHPDSSSRGAMDQALPRAKSVTITIAAALPNQDPQSLGSRTYPLAGTQEALRRTPNLAAEPVGLVEPAIPPGIARWGDKALQDMGVPDGVAGMAGMLGRLLRN